jgi:hypothetical protein
MTFDFAPCIGSSGLEPRCSNSLSTTRNSAEAAWKFVINQVPRPWDSVPRKITYVPEGNPRRTIASRLLMNMLFSMRQDSDGSLQRSVTQVSVAKSHCRNASSNWAGEMAMRGPMISTAETRPLYSPDPCLARVAARPASDYSRSISLVKAEVLFHTQIGRTE